MNSITAIHEINTHSVQIKLTIVVDSQLGVDATGTFKRASQAGCAQALAIFLDGLEASEASLKEAIESELNGIDDTSDPEE